MASAAAPYVAWMHQTAAQAAQTAAQATEAATAYETAFAAHVPPPVIAENRALLAQLVATNLFGQNTAAIAANEAQYSEMWAQDAMAMDTYFVSSATASNKLTAVQPGAADHQRGGRADASGRADHGHQHRGRQRGSHRVTGGDNHPAVQRAILAILANLATPTTSS